MKATIKRKFQKLGGSRHLVIRGPEDLRRIITIDEPYWMATSAPLNAFTCDERVLILLDTDKNKRIRCHEVRAAIDWLLTTLLDHSQIGYAADELKLSSVNTETESGRRIHVGARRILKNLHCPDAETISLAQVRDRTTILAAGGTNGDGIIPPVESQAPKLQKFITDLITHVGSEIDASGLKGVTEDILAKFVEEGNKFLHWYRQGIDESGEKNKDVFPWGDRTAIIIELFERLNAKIDEFFLFSQSIAFVTSWDEAGQELSDAINRRPDQSEALTDVLKRLPLASPSTDGRLRFDRSINPAYRPVLQAFAEQLSLAGSGELMADMDIAEWQRIKASVVPYLTWKKSRPDCCISKLDTEILIDYLKGSYVQDVRKLIQHDLRIGRELASIEEIEKIILFQKWLPRICNNFVSFPELYEPEKRALFEWGTLILDGRSFKLCLPVDDRTAHKQVARYSGIFLIYAKIFQKNDGVSQEIVVAITSGNAGRICVGKKGVFYTPSGREFDAEVVEIIKNPISLIEAFFHPFKRLGEIAESQIEKIIGRGEKELESALDKKSTLISKSIGEIETSAQNQQAAPVKPVVLPQPDKQNTQQGSDKNFFRDFVVGLSVSVAAIGSSFAFITKMLSEVKLSHIIATLIACIILILGPITILTFIKLHRRDIGMLMEASGWAINGRMRLTRKLCRTLTADPERLLS